MVNIYHVIVLRIMVALNSLQKTNVAVCETNNDYGIFNKIVEAYIVMPSLLL